MRTLETVADIAILPAGHRGQGARELRREAGC